MSNDILLNAPILENEPLTIKQIMNIKKQSPLKYKKTEKLVRGFGIEHEAYLFHLDASKKVIKNVIVFNSKLATIDLIKNQNNYKNKKNKLTYAEKNELLQIPLEHSGRKCKNKYVLKKILSSGMPEFISGNAFSKSILDQGWNGIENYISDIQTKEDKFIKIQTKNPKTRKLIDKYGVLSFYPFGTSSFIRKTNDEKEFHSMYKFDTKKYYRDYTGSYHITITLPFHLDDTKMSNMEFIKMHSNFGNQIQWIEPLLIASFFSADDKALFNDKSQKRIKGSFRVCQTSWGNLAGTDVRKLGAGVGRYANIISYWRKNMKFYESEKLKWCEKEKMDEPGSISSFSSDIRTFGSRDPLRVWHRNSGVGLKKPNGIEIRIFDHFHSRYLIELCRLLVYLAENSIRHKTPKYVYKNKSWIKATQTVMYDGWCAMFPKSYVNELRKALGLKIKTESLLAFQVLQQVNKELFDKNKNGLIPYQMLSKKYRHPPHLPTINRDSLDCGLLFKFNNEPKLFKQFKQFIYDLEKESSKNATHEEPMKFSKFAEIFNKHFTNQMWQSDVKYIAYFLESIQIAKTIHNIDGTIHSVKIIKKYIKKLNTSSVNEKIFEYFDWVFTRPSKNAHSDSKYPYITLLK